jgi:hypothetical protein
MSTPTPPLGVRLRLFLFGAPHIETYPEFVARLRRRERWLRRLGCVAGVLLACLTAWLAVGAYVGSWP